MKKTLVLLLTLLMVCSLAACAAKQPAAEGSAAAEDAASEDTQNPIMNFMGTYAQGRATMIVEPDGMENAKITIKWGSSAAEHREWAMTGKLDPDTLVLDYADCLCKDVVFKEDGTVESETVVYENGTGSFTFLVADDGTTTLTWDDATEHQADGLVFEYVSASISE